MAALSLPAATLGSLQPVRGSSASAAGGVSMASVRCELQSGKGAVEVRRTGAGREASGRRSRRGGHHVCRAAEEDRLEELKSAVVSAKEKVEEAAAGEGKGPARQQRERGQVTAIVTGAISVILGLAYLVLVQAIDTRGVNMIPPPPEAYGD